MKENKTTQFSITLSPAIFHSDLRYFVIVSD